MSIYNNIMMSHRCKSTVVASRGGTITSGLEGEGEGRGGGGGGGGGGVQTVPWYMH